MAGNQVTLTFAGDAKQLLSTMDDVKSKTERTTTTIRESGGNFRKLQDGFDAIDQGAMGFRDTITGTQDVWKAFNDDSLTAQERALTLGMGIGDLASGFANLIIPLTAVSAAQIKTTATRVAGWASTAAAAGASVATQVASWVLLGAQSLLAAAKVALAWLISMGPIVLVIAAVVGLVYLIVKNWDTIKRVIGAGWDWVKNKSVAVWNAVVGFVKRVIGQMVANVRMQINAVKAVFNAMRSAISSIMNRVATAITSPFRRAFNTVRNLWNSTIGGFSFSAPSWVPGFGGKGITIPKMAMGGIVDRPTLAMIGEGNESEAVIPLSKLERMVGGGGRQVIELHSSGGRLDDVLLEILRQAISSRGGNVAVLG